MSPIDPDCLVGKHTACPGYTYDLIDDITMEQVPCACGCHTTPEPADRHE